MNLKPQTIDMSQLNYDINQIGERLGFETLPISYIPPKYCKCFDCVVYKENLTSSFSFINVNKFTENQINHYGNTAHNPTFVKTFFTAFKDYLLSLNNYRDNIKQNCINGFYHAFNEAFKTFYE